MADKKLIDIDRLSKYHENINALLTTKQESLVSGDNIKTINGESILGDGDINLGITPITWGDLVTLRDNSMLVPGQQYRIIDYITTTDQENTQSAGHQFDIIVTADTNNVLNENARTCLHEGDKYFSNAGAKLETWQIKYCLDNDKDRFAWAKGMPEYKAEFVGMYWDDPVNGVNYDSHIGDDKIYDWGTLYDSELEYDNIVIYKSDENIYIEEGTADYEDKYFYRGVVVVDGIEYDSWKKWDVTDDGWCYSDEFGYQYAITERIVFNNEVVWPELKSKFVNVYNSSSCTIREEFDAGSDDSGYNALTNFIDPSVIMMNDPENGDPYGFLEKDRFSHYGYEYEPNGGYSLFLLGRNLFHDEDNNITEDEGLNTENRYYYRGVVTVDGDEYDCWQKWEIEAGGTEYGYAPGGNNYYYLTHRIVDGEVSIEKKEEYCTGTGVIYNMIDEHNNECPYDFKNIMFFREDYSNYIYTFNWINSSLNMMDTSIFGNGTLTVEELSKYGVYGNIIKPCFTDDTREQLTLNNIVFVSSYHYNNGVFFGIVRNIFGYNCHDITFGDDCDFNTFGDNCYSITFGNGCRSNTFGNNFQENKFGNNCQENTFGNECCRTTFGNNCQENTFGNGCRSNTFGNRCRLNTLGKYCQYITFGNGCDNNIFGNGCDNNIFGNECVSNIFGDNYNFNTLGYNFHNNTFGDDCCDNTFGNYCDSNEFGYNYESNKFGDYCTSNTFGHGCGYNTFGDYFCDNTFDENCTSNTFGVFCNGNTFSNNSNGNTFGNYCDSNDVDNECVSNIFGDNCSDNKLGDYCSSNTFGDRCSHNTFDDRSMYNTFGNNCNYNTFGYECVSNTFGSDCCSNTFGEECNSNTFAQNCNSNEFSDGCSSNKFADYCSSNKFGDNCDSNVFANQCHHNTFGDSCSSNTFDNSCANNTFDNSCGSNKFGNNCYENTFGNGCSSNTFDNVCYHNTFGDNCYSITFGNGCCSNTFGNECYKNTFGNDCTNNTFGSYYRYIMFDNGNSYIDLNATSTIPGLNYYQNVRVGLGVNNTTNRKTINDSNVNQTYETLYVPANSQTITI